MEQQISPWVLIGFNAILGIASVFGVMWLRRMEKDMTDMQTAHRNSETARAARELALQQQLQGYVAKEDFREFRLEIQGNFRDVFDRLDRLVERSHNKG